jgi:lipopolysaccharide biosynthesis protein
MFSYQLTDLQDRPVIARWRHGFTSAGTIGRFIRRMVDLGRELSGALLCDLTDRILRPPAFRRVDVGFSEATKSVAVYVHYSSSGQVSQMVIEQLACLHRAGFTVVFVSMSETILETDWQDVRQYCLLLIQRRNMGLDFGAWHDVIPLIEQWPVEELLLMNDSMLGPIYPFPPIIATLRSGGDGLFGLTESRQGGVHLQSYLLLARGPAAVTDLMLFLTQMKISHSKWLIIQRGELRLTRWMRSRGHRVAAMFDYDRVAALPGQIWPLNPTHHLWRVLISQGFPFLKTELVRRNPGRIDVSDWQSLIPDDAPCNLECLLSHLRKR